MGVRITTSGDWKNTENWLKKLEKGDIFASLEKFGQVGVQALSSATQELTGVAAGSWGYEIEQRSGYFSIRWTNSDTEDGFPVAIMLQYGHGTRQGGYVEGRDYINPAIKPIFDQIEAETRRVVMQ
jgi:hypothetical protein